MRLMVVVRHGATANNSQQRYTGHSDVPLSPLGLRQAEALAAVLAAETFDLILSSDLVRAANRRGQHRPQRRPAPAGHRPA